MNLPDKLGQGSLLIKGSLGSGAQASVVEALDVMTGEALAIKVATQKAASARFLAEASALLELKHPRIVQVYEAQTEPPYVWFSMELFRKGTLYDHLTNHRVKTSEAIEWGLDMLWALGTLHAHGIIHRDLKPTNVFLSDDNHAILGDLGVARMPKERVNYQTATGANLGSLDYQAPEQAINAKAVTEAADFYGLTATLYLLLTRERPSMLYALDEKFQHEALDLRIRPWMRRNADHDPARRHQTAREAGWELAYILGRERAEAWIREFDRTAKPQPGLIEQIKAWFS